MNKSNLKFKQLHSNQISSYLDQIANLRIQIFKEYPYLYEGDLDYEYDYLSRYVNASDSLISLAVYDNTIVGATTCIPLIQEHEGFRKPLLDNGFNITNAFYFGESIVLPSFRGFGIGKEFFNIREKHASNTIADLSLTCFCVVERLNHPLKPSNYKPLNSFWESLGYTEYINVSVFYPWKDIDKEEEDLKKMNYWVKKWK